MTPHFAFPFQIIGPSAMVVGQDSLDEIAQSAQIILTTALGSRLELPGFGIRDLTFDVTIPYDEILSALQQWDPRAQVVFSEEPGKLDTLIRTIITRISTQGGG